MSMLTEIFSWWGGNTWGTRLTTLRLGRQVGADAGGNRYFVQKKGVGPLGVPRRWVIYSDLADASKVPPEWHGWLHHTVDSVPTDEAYVAQSWQKPHVMNMTGTPQAWRPQGSILNAAVRPKATGDYKAWKPD